MAISWSYEEGFIIINVSGVLTKPEITEFQLDVEPVIQKGRAKLLVILTDFEGWDDDSGDWSDLSFGNENEKYIQGMAIVGASQWKVSVEMFTMKGFRKYPIEYFLEGQDDFAKSWLA